MIIFVSMSQKSERRHLVIIRVLLHKLKLSLNLKLPLSSRTLLAKMALIFCCTKQF